MDFLDLNIVKCETEQDLLPVCMRLLKHIKKNGLIYKYDLKNDLSIQPEIIASLDISKENIR